MAAHNQPAGKQPNPTTQSRPRELEDWLNFRLYHPLSMRLAKALQNTPVTPNMVSIIGGLMIVLAAYIYAAFPSPTGIFIGLLAHMSWHIFDGADGDLARLTGRSSPQGEVIDGICDYLGHIILYLTLAWMLSDNLGINALILAIVSGIARIVQAAHYEVQRRQYQHWVYGTPWLRISNEQAERPKGILGAFASSYIALAQMLAPGARDVDAMVANASESDLRKLRGIIRHETAPVLRFITPLSANYRTLAFGLLILAGVPLYYFIFEAVLLSIILIVSIAIAGQSTRRIIHQAELSNLR